MWSGYFRLSWLNFLQYSLRKNTYLLYSFYNKRDTGGLVVEYFLCDCCGMKTREDEFYTNVLCKNEDVCQKCDSMALELLEKEKMTNECSCRGGCSYCLMLEY